MTARPPSITALWVAAEACDRRGGCRRPCDACTVRRMLSSSRVAQAVSCIRALARLTLWATLALGPWVAIYFAASSIVGP